MTPTEALAQIVQSVELNPAANVNALRRVAEVALRDSGEHGLLFVLPGRDVQTIHCYCGSHWTVSNGLIAADLLIAEHIEVLKRTA